MSTSRYAYLEALSQVVEEEIVVTCLGAPTKLWHRLRPRDQDIYIYDAMGMAIPVALGLAAAVWPRRVLAMEGDGALLMNLGSLLTVVGAGMSNLTILLFNNGVYESSGGQPLPCRGVDFAALARAAGIPTAVRVDSAAALVEAVRRAARSGMLSFIDALTVPEVGPPEPYVGRPPQVRPRFLRWWRGARETTA
ncbi:MAG: thiamine pyrophosphate-dependent enzyme [Armatimonadota bacterium]|nr:thiamine pyrophosphate-dependent enzyme [Armatimonadota bacterium]